MPGYIISLTPQRNCFSSLLKAFLLSFGVMVYVEIPWVSFDASWNSGKSCIWRKPWTDLTSWPHPPNVVYISNPFLRLLSMVRYLATLFSTVYNPCGLVIVQYYTLYNHYQLLQHLSYKVNHSNLLYLIRLSNLARFLWGWHWKSYNIQDTCTCTNKFVSQLRSQSIV